MIIISDKNKENLIYFPKSIYEYYDFYKLVIVDRCSNKKIEFENISDNNNANFGFYSFLIDFSECPSGEYEYEIYGTNEKELSNGLIRLNELEKENIIYNNERTYIVYDKQ